MHNEPVTEPWPKPGVAWYAVSVLLVAFLFSAVDRVILGMLIIPIKEDLGVSDAAMGSLLGVAFAVAFTLSLIHISEPTRPY